MADRLRSAGRRSGEEGGEGFALAALAAIALTTVAWWALALWPVEGVTPQWLARARVVCFGIVDDGLPDTAGWIGLVGQPLGMLAVLAVGWRRSLGRGLRRLGGDLGPRRVVGAGAALAALALALVGARVTGAGASQAAILGGGAPAEVPSTYPRLDLPAPALRLVGEAGDTVDLRDFAGRTVLVTFAYGHCADVCPALVRDVLEAQRVAGGGAAGTGSPTGTPAVLVVTLDPWRDTPSRLPHLAAAWDLGDDARLLSGDPADVEAVLDAWRVARSRDTSTGEVVHPRLTYLVDGDGRIAYASTGGAGELAALLERLH